MKFFLFLFSIYLLALGCLPCADDKCLKDGTVIESKALHTSDCHGEEVCSPFCICNCCSIHITAANNIIHSAAPLQREIAEQQTIAVHQPLITRAGNSIWQPPRLG
jgi:hypothetical protein